MNVISTEINLNSERRSNLLRHIQNVQSSCFLLGERLIKSGEERLGHDLIANGLVHDNSKWHGIEWIYLHSDLFGGEYSDMLALAIKQHVTTNPHHSEYWDSEEGSGDGIHNMPRVYIAEMICDWHSRSHEFGNDLRDWIKNKAMSKFGMKPQSQSYKKVKYFLEMLLDPAFNGVNLKGSK